MPEGCFIHAIKNRNIYIKDDIGVCSGVKITVTFQLNPLVIFRSPLSVTGYQTTEPTGWLKQSTECTTQDGMILDQSRTLRDYILHYIGWFLIIIKTYQTKALCLYNTLLYFYCKSSLMSEM